MSRTTPVALTCALLLSLALAWPAAAPAAVTVGSELAGAPLTSAGCSGPCTAYVETGFARVGAVPFDGVITRWRTRAPSNSNWTARLQVARPGTPTWTRIAEAVGTNVGSGVSRFETRIPVRTGDRIGIGSYDGANLSLIGGDGGTYRRFAPPLTATPAAPGPQETGELPIAADVEPDVDGDGYGDDTQDVCPDDAARQAAPCSGALIGPDVRYDRSFGGAAVSGGLETRATLTGPAAPVVAADGVLVRARVLAFHGAFGVQVLRPGAGDRVVVGQEALSAPVAPEEDAAFARLVQLPARIPVRAGDVLGFRVTRGSSFAIRSDGSSVMSTFDPALVPGRPAPAAFLGPVFAAISGDVEPDADGDGYGDDTQDGCPIDPGRQGACVGLPPAPPTPPTPPAPQVIREVVLTPGPETTRTLRPGAARLAVSRLRYRGTRSLRVPLTCPASAESCTGRLELRVGRRLAGTASFALRAGQRRSVAVKLDARARRALRRGGKVSVRIVPQGPKATTGTLTLTR
jgi:hypothetical protein